MPSGTNEMTQSSQKDIPLPAEASQVWGETLKRTKEVQKTHFKKIQKNLNLNVHPTAKIGSQCTQAILSESLK